MGVTRSLDKRQRKIPASTGKIEYDDQIIPYELIESNRKSYAIEIKPGGAVIVRTPAHPSGEFLIQLFHEKEKWIKSKYSEQRMAAFPESGCTEAQKTYLENKYRTAAKEFIRKRVDYYLVITGGTYKKLAIRDQKTRWGSCSAKGTLSFNWKLMLAPLKVLDYVVVHELCHLKYMDHSKAFWCEVEKVMPDYLEMKKWLRENGGRLQNCTVFVPRA